MDSLSNHQLHLQIKVLYLLQVTFCGIFYHYFDLVVKNIQEIFLSNQSITPASLQTSTMPHHNQHPPTLQRNRNLGTCLKLTKKSTIKHATMKHSTPTA